MLFVDVDNLFIVIQSLSIPPEIVATPEIHTSKLLHYFNNGTEWLEKQSYDYDNGLIQNLYYDEVASDLYVTANSELVILHFIGTDFTFDALSATKVYPSGSANLRIAFPDYYDGVKYLQAIYSSDTVAFNTIYTMDDYKIEYYDTYTLFNLLVRDNAKIAIKGIYHDYAHYTVYAGIYINAPTSNPTNEQMVKIYYHDYEKQSVSRIEDIVYTGDIDNEFNGITMGIDTGSRKLFIGTSDPGSGDTETYTLDTVTFNDCSTATDCQSCFSINRGYCGICYEDANNLFDFDPTESCVQDFDCGNQFSTDPLDNTCPSIFGIMSYDSSIVGLKELYFNGNYEFPEDTVCEWDFNGEVSTSCGSRIEDGDLYCLTPAKKPEFSTNGNISLIIDNNLNIFYTNDEINFNYYDCSDYSCEECTFIGTDCGWCIEDSTCLSEITCFSNNNTWSRDRTVCSVVEVSSTYLSKDSTFSISASNIDTSIDYYCGIDVDGTVYTTSATHISGGVDCVVDFGISYDPARGYDLGLYTNEIALSRVGNNELVYIADCLDIPCHYCDDFCDSCGACADPTISSDRSQYSTSQSIFVTTSDPVAGSYYCVLTSGKTPITIAATQISPTLLKCTNTDKITGNYKLAIKDVSDYYGNSVDIEIYECSQLSCDECGTYPNCRYCLQNKLPGSCRENSLCLAEFEYPTCPYIVDDASPLSDDIGGGTTLTLTGQFTEEFSSQVECAFGIPDTLVSTSVVSFKSDTLMTCVIPSYEVTGNVSFWLQRIKGDDESDRAHTLLTTPSDYDFQYYDCSDNIVCDQCIGSTSSAYSYENCGWCSGGCNGVGSDECAGQTVTNLCPSLDTSVLSIESNLPSAISGIMITDLSGTFNSEVTYQCIFTGPSNREITATFIDANTISCSTGGLVTGDYTIQVNYFLDLSIPVCSLVDEYEFDVIVESIPYTSDLVPLVIFGCPDVSCEACSANGYCGYCINTGAAECNSELKCDYDTDAYDWSQDTCIEIISSPPGSGLEGDYEIELIFVDGTYNLDESNGISYFGDASTIAGGVKCVFEDEEGDEIDSFDSTIIISQSVIYVGCTTPVVDSATAGSVSLYYRNELIAPPVDFDFVDCTSFSVCGNSWSDEVEACETQPACGWCVELNDCTLGISCTDGLFLSNANSNTNNSCPQIVDIEPSDIPTNKVTEVTITGMFLSSNIEYALHINGEEAITGLFFEDDELIVELPERETEETVSISFWTDGEKASGDFQVTYAVPEKGLNLVAIIVPIVATLIIIIILIIVAIVYSRWKKKQNIFVGLNIDLLEPDYEVLMFGQDLTVRNYNMPVNDIRRFRDSLFNPDSVIFNAFVSVLTSGDMDRASKNLIYLLESYQCTMPFLIKVIAGEIDYCEHPNTIFRGNSLASKMFKTYSRLHGLEYLFHKLAFHITELEMYTIKKMHINEQGEGRLNPLLNREFEVDENKLDADSFKDLKSNYYALQKECYSIFSKVVNNEQDVPQSFKMVFTQVNNMMLDKFEEIDEKSVYYAVGGLFFLRFVIPSIVAPHYYGLLQDPPSDPTQRQLILISKILQSIANMALPGKKETYLEFMTHFIEENIPKVEDFYVEIMDEQMSDDVPIVEIPPQVLENAAGAIFNMFALKADRIKGHLTDIGQVEYAREVEDLMRSIELPEKV
eukprot:TRINITY_DN7193_c0_g1_i1.p1 TRINITY_DN7193_c0_g1~~TRINITY_DN7193_c0_g1_i1.p1  ORF type:complete len:1667 (+),score=361.12 TRINITY_DN7193_c0_g1_i1:509-5509(+)